MKNQGGITLLALVISIIVMLILAGVSLNATIGENGIILKAQEAKIMNTYAAYKEGVELYINGNVTLSGEELKKHIPAMEEQDLKKFVLISGELYYIGNSEYERKIAEELGINTSYSKLNMFPEDVINIVGEILSKSNQAEFPKTDNDKSPEEFVGKRLYDKNTTNDTKWDIVIDYSNDDEKREIGRWGSGYYLLKAGSYEINGKTINLAGDYIIDYRENKLIPLSKNYVDWNINTTLGTTEGLVLNLDPSNFEEFLDLEGNLDASKLKEKASIDKHGDVAYNREKKELLFNEDKSNSIGEGGYLELAGGKADFTNGFTFEIYGIWRRLNYANGRGDSWVRGGIFCRMESLQSTFYNAMRFGLGDKIEDPTKISCRVGPNDGNFDGDNMRTRDGQSMSTIENPLTIRKTY